MIGIDRERFFSEEINPELHEGVLHGKEFLVVNRIVPFSRFEQTGFVRDDTFVVIGIVLHKRTTDGIIAGVADDVERAIKVWQSQDWGIGEAVFNRLKCLLMGLCPIKGGIFVKQQRQRTDGCGKIFGVLMVI